MIRYTILTAAIIYVIGIAWRDWFKSLCGVIAFMAIYHRKDMPTAMFGVPGINPFNVMLLNVVLAWIASRGRERLRWDMPAYLNGLLLLYLIITLVAFGRLMLDRNNKLLETSVAGLVAEDFLNTYKWIIPALLLFDGCRSRARFNLAVFSTLLIYVLLGIQVARQIPPTGDLSELERMSRERLNKQTGYHRVELSTMLSGASWAILAGRVLLKRRSHRTWAMLASLGVFYSQLLTAGRAGYVAWGFIAGVLSSLRWRRYLVMAGGLVLVVILAFPAVVGRMLEGIESDSSDVAGRGASDDDDASGLDVHKILAGRNEIWPFVIDKILSNPIIGYGRKAHIRLGLAALHGEELGEGYGHPHNAYLELLLDSGLVGFVPVMAFFTVALYQSLMLFRDSRSPVFIAAGGMSMALILGWMVGSMTAQTFYPREGCVGMWCAMMLVFRVYVERSRALARLRRAVPRARLALVSPPASPVAAAGRQPALARAPARRRASGARRGTEGQEAASTLDDQLWARPA